MNNSVTGPEDLGVNSVFYCVMGLWVTHTKAVQKGGRQQQRLGGKPEICDISSALWGEWERGGKDKTWTRDGQSRKDDLLHLGVCSCCLSEVNMRKLHLSWC